MYESWFGMENTPFAKGLPTQSLYESPAMANAFGRLTYAANHNLFAVVTADAGCGKSTLIRRFAASLQKDTHLLLYLSDSQLTPRMLYMEMLDQLGLEPKHNRGEVKRQVQRELDTIRNVKGKKIVCVLDEAHLLEKDTLEEFRFLLNASFDSVNPMALILVGQTELWDEKLRLQRYAAIRQRINIYCVLPHLDRAETAQYIAAHMKYSGCGQLDTFTDKAIDEVFGISTGIPRIINRICEQSLTYAFQQRKKLVDDHMVRYVDEHEMLPV